METLEQAAMLMVFILLGTAGLITHWALKLKKVAEARAELEAGKRMEAELKNEIDKMDIDRLIDESNKRKGR